MNGPQLPLASLVGQTVAKLHSSHVVHGDLTTSNFLVKNQPDSEGDNSPTLVLIDFGLSTIESAHVPEDKGN